MPNQNGTGPFGDGRPGRGLGPCGRFNRGCFGGGRGFGLRRRGNWNNEPFILKQTAGNGIYAYTKAELEAQKNELEQQLKWLNEQLSDNKED
jgi:hypothetical protein